MWYVNLNYSRGLCNVGILKIINNSSLFGIQVAFMNKDCGIIAYIYNMIIKQDPILRIIITASFKKSIYNKISLLFSCTVL